ncbi:hypothetical protein ACU8LZ_25660 (plasmid) [Rhizobium leguminosarum]
MEECFSSEPKAWRYAKAGATTVGEIISKYGGGQDYTNYVKFVKNQTGYSDAFGKALFRYEAGRQTPLLDEQILYGFKLARNGGSPAGLQAPAAASLLKDVKTPPTPPSLFSLATLPQIPSPISLDTIEGVRALQEVLIRCGYLDPPADGDSDL